MFLVGVPNLVDDLSFMDVIVQHDALLFNCGKTFHAEADCSVAFFCAELADFHIKKGVIAGSLLL